MPNHVHVLLLPLISASKLLQSLKGYTARQANLLLGRTGKKFWQAESYDHWVRDDREMERSSAVRTSRTIPSRLGLWTVLGSIVGRAPGGASRRFSTLQTRVSAPRKQVSSLAVATSISSSAKVRGPRRQLRDRQEPPLEGGPWRASHGRRPWRFATRCETIGTIFPPSYRH